jgi:uncharacterized DUF497 family protein
MHAGFEWDAHKAAVNAWKHGVRFDEATTVFNDPLAVIFDDEDHSVHEAREVVIGHSINHCLLLVCFTERPHDVIRVFSARKATKKERQAYEQNRRP